MVSECLFPSVWLLLDRCAQTDILFLRLGLEGLVMFKRDTQFDAENYTITVPSSDAEKPDVTISVFDKVMVRIEVEKDKNTQRTG